MKKITIMYDGSVYTKRWLWTLIWDKKSFLKKDICFKFVPIQNIKKFNWGGLKLITNRELYVWPFMMVLEICLIQKNFCFYRN